MSSLIAISYLKFSVKKEELPTWSEKYRAKAKHSGIKDALLGKLQIPKTSEKFEKKVRRRKMNVEKCFPQRVSFY
jgi:hypothetical protein